LCAEELVSDAMLVAKRVEIEIATNSDLIAINFLNKLGFSISCRAFAEIKLSELEAMIVLKTLCKSYSN